MDFWSRLVSGGSPSVKKQVNSNSPQQRLVRFKRATDHLQQVWQKSKTRPTDPATAENVRTCLASLTRILQDESHATIPHLCIEYAASAQVYIPATEIALSTLDGGIIHALLALLNKLVDSEGGNFLDNRAFAGSVTTFAKEIIAQRFIDSDIGASLFEVLFSIAAKLRLQPEDIRSWFKRRAQGIDEASENHAAPQSRFNDVAGDFPLFYVLLDHVHYDGKVGEFARTGLLYIIESSARSEWLEKWIVESDLATLMASGLGALYSQLSRKLVVSYARDAGPPIIAFSEEAGNPPAFDVEETSSQEFREGLVTFLKYLQFWQDVLENCTSDDVKQTLLEHFEFLFLKQLLYPSLLESSDIDGGFVAVLTYLRCILLTVDHPELTHRILHYLLAIPKKPAGGSSSSRPARPATLARRHKSETLIRKQAENPEEFSPGLYTLVDMILGGLKSHSQQTTAATLRLLDTILSRRHQYCVPGLIKARMLQPEDMKRSISAHDKNLDALLSMAEDLIEEDTDLCYDSHLQDARVLLEDHVCSTGLLSLPSSGAVLDQQNLPQRQLDWPNPIKGHTVDPADPLLQSMLFLLDRFFLNNIETNLSLTQALSSLASCGHLNLEGWLLDGCVGTKSPMRDSAASPTSLELALKSGEIQIDNKVLPDTSHMEDRAFTDRTVSTPPILQSLDSLVAQVNHFRQEIEDFEVYLMERRHVFKAGEEIEGVTNDAPPSSSPARGSKAIPLDKARASGQMVSIPERLLSNNNSVTVSRASSPRGRQHNTPSAPALMGRLSHLRISPSPSPSKDSTASPLRRDSFSSTPSKNTGHPTGLANALRQQIKIPRSISKRRNHSLDIGSSEASSTRSEPIEPGFDQRRDVVEVRLSKILANVLILHEFLLELAAIVEVRASLFGEVSFD